MSAPRSASDLVTRPLALLGATVIGWLALLGRFTIFSVNALSCIVRPPFFWREILRSVLQIGWMSLPVVGLTAIFTGGALTLQIHAGGARFDAEAVVPQIVAIGMVRELGPVLVGLMIAARVTSSIAAELSTMKVTEQIDALVTLSTDPIRYLVVPRVLTGLVCVPILVGIGDLIGIFGGYAVATQQLGFTPSVYLHNTVNFLEPIDIISSLVKGAAFGTLSCLTGCYAGLGAGRGAAGVGRATKSAVEASAVLILAANFILTGVFFSL